MRHKRFGIDVLVVEGKDVSLRYCDLLVAVQEGSADVDWECLASSNDEVRLVQREYPLVLRSQGREFTGTAIVVRSDGVSHVFRGVGPLAGVVDDELGSSSGPDAGGDAAG